MRRIPVGLMLGIFVFVIYLFFQTRGIYGGDSGDLVSAAATAGIAHPPGYPLYTWLGRIASMLPVSTPSWRVTLLSSLPHAGVVVIVYITVLRLTGSIPSAMISAVMLAGNYLFFLYSITPEVFALFDVFVASISYLCIRIIQTKRTRFLPLLSFLIGLALSHHHVIFFLFPGVLAALFVGVKGTRRALSQTATLIVSFFLGLVPYMYIPIVARTSPLISWNNPITIEGFVNLVTRAYYGTFLSNKFYGEQLIQRLLSVKAYGEFMLKDFHVLGIMVGIVGLVWVVRTYRSIGAFLLLSLFFIGPFFLFYASFPLMNRFTLGTFERFLLPSYVVFSICVGCGFSVVIGLTKKYGKKLSFLSHRFVLGGLYLLSSAYVLVIGITTMIMCFGLSGDMTANNLGIDFLSSVKPNSILLLIGDSSLFTTQYVRYVLGFRQDVYVLHLYRLTQPDYTYVVKKNFPNLVIPEGQTGIQLTDFVRANMNAHTIYSNSRFSLGDSYAWIPRGIVFELVPASQTPLIERIMSDNATLWGLYHNPNAGVLSRYKHLMLADILNVYTQSRMYMGKTLLSLDRVAEAQREFFQAINLGGDYFLSEAYTYLGLTYMFQKNCDAAIAAFEQSKEIDLYTPAHVHYFQAVTYKDCYKNQDTAREYLKRFESERVKQETPLESL